MTQEDLQKILEAAVRAPSGENCQPWRFASYGKTLRIYNLPERDQSPYNFHQFGSLVSHGAVIENIVIAASQLCYQADVVLFPYPDDFDCTAVITFTKNENVKKDELGESIFFRASNRTPYSTSQIVDNKDMEYVIGQAAKTDASAKLIMVDKEEKKKKISGALSYGDRLLFENRAIHDFLFGHIYWTLADVSIKKSGFYVKELALTPPQAFIFKLLKKETMRRFFSKIGLPVMAAKENAALYERSPLLGAITIKGNSPSDFIASGRLMERTWLAATKLGYDMQLITAIAFFHQRIVGNEANIFSKDQIKGIEAAYAVLKDEFEVSKDTVAIVFRMGKGKPLPHRSLRLDPVFEYHP